MSDTLYENIKNQLWEKKPFPTRDYLLACIGEELQELNENLKSLNHR